MTRLFIRFYLGVLFILVTAWFVQGVVFRERSEEQNERVVEQALAGGLRLVRDRIEEHGNADTESLLQEIQEDFGYPVELLCIDDDVYGHDARERLKNYDEVVLYRRRGAKVATALSDAKTVVSFGPLPRFVGPSQAEVFAGFGLILLLAALAIAVLLRPVARQLLEVERTATAIAEGDLAARVDAVKVPKGQQLARAFNAMAERTEALLRTQRELLQAVSHELRTPLARMRFAIDLIGTAKSDEERQVRLESLDAATEELDNLVGELLSYVRMETAEKKLELQQVVLSDAIENLVEKCSALFPSVDIQVDRSQQCGSVVRADTAGLERALGNLITNACRFARQQVRVRAIPINGHVAIDVEDDGVGIPIEERERVLQPFVRLENESESGRGVGLGLALVNRIVTSHGGNIHIDDSTLGGCRVRTTWPT